MKILGIETSSSIFSLCLSEELNIIYEVRQNRELFPAQHGSIFTETERVMKNLNGENLAAIVVSIGPGMFTSLRVGLSLAKGLSLALNVPLVAVNTLDAIGLSIADLYKPFLSQNFGFIGAVINAYQNELYAAIYKNNERVSEYLLTTPGNLFNILERLTGKSTPVFIGGPGVEALKKEKTPQTLQISYLDKTFFLTSSMLIPLALPSIRQKKFCNPDLLEPFYLKKTAAEK